ncbi:Gldg family protein [Gloeocapsa sp. PCC 73106]|uniref:GldG family protein n=1 Tax=Gloeocapsa sp. PCC 73106 TaxID=102232 RepID=UPI0002AD036C|nr:Gldg family protein [Gloeocapsa sp. PCC 73106]ELR98008.1 ABC-type uncharacterized transport system involved in gliding motility, auxiliary component [Gloeocapsa sp. PCC 73106]
MKYLKLLYIVGFLVSIVGLIAGLISQLWLPIPISLLAIGLLLVCLPRGGQFWRKRSIVVGTNTIITTLAFMLILGLLNFLAVRHDVRVDLTENQLFTLSPQSQAIVANLKGPLKVWVFQEQINPGAQELLKNYRRYNPQFNFTFVDPEIEIQLAKKFEIQSPGEVHMEYQGKKRLIQRITEIEPLSEAKLTSAIQAIQSDRSPRTLYFLQGHGETELNAVEAGLSEAVDSLEAKGYRVQPLNLAKVAKIPEDTGVIIIVSPKRALLEGETKAIKTYLENKGKLLLMIDPDTNSGLEKLLQDWGVKLDERIVIDVSGRGSLIGLGPATVVVTDYGNHPITQAFGEGISIYPVARPISTNTLPEVEAVALLITDEQTWAEARLDSQDIEFDPQEDIKGPLDIGVALTRDSSRLAIIGNSTFVTNGWFTQQLNGDVFLNTVEWLGDTEESILSIRPKEPQNRRLNLTLMHSNLLSWLALVIVPLLGFITALITWWRRR